MLGMRGLLNICCCLNNNMVFKVEPLLLDKESFALSEIATINSLCLVDMFLNDKENI